MEMDGRSVADSSTSVLEEEVSNETALPLELEARNGDVTLISEAMAKEEKLMEERAKESKEEEKKLDPNFKFNKLDELLTQTQLFSQFLLEKIEDITANAAEVKVDVKEEVNPKGKKGRKRKSTKTLYNPSKVLQVYEQATCDYAKFSSH